MNATRTVPAPLTKSTDPVSQGQVDYLNNLLRDIGEIWPGKAEELRHQLRCEYLAHTLTMCVASTRINEFKMIREDLRTKNAQDLEKLRQMEQGLPVPAPRASEPRPQVPAGRYAVEREDGVLAFYRVAVDNGRYTVFVFASDRQHKIKGWKSMQTILRKIEAAGIDAAGQRFADERGECRDCGRALTDRISRERGRGEICFSRL
jgi:hypothetical protein